MFNGSAYALLNGRHFTSCKNRPPGASRAPPDLHLMCVRRRPLSALQWHNSPWLCVCYPIWFVSGPHCCWWLSNWKSSSRANVWRTAEACTQCVPVVLLHMKDLIKSDGWECLQVRDGQKIKAEFFHSSDENVSVLVLALYSLLFKDE